MLADDGERATFYAGPATVELHRAETANYRDNLASGSPALWVVLRETGAEPPYALYLVTADPSEGEAMTEAGGNIVEPVPMPEAVRDAVAVFIAEHHVERGVREAQAGPAPIRIRSDAVRPRCERTGDDGIGTYGRQLPGSAGRARRSTRSAKRLKRRPRPPTKNLAQPASGRLARAARRGGRNRPGQGSAETRIRSSPVCRRSIRSRR